MTPRVQLGELDTWYAEHGSGDPLVLLHPGGADAGAWAPNLDALAAHFRVLTPERRAHGRTPDVEGPITYELMTRDTVSFLEAVPHAPAHLSPPTRLRTRRCARVTSSCPRTARTTIPRCTPNSRG